MSGITLEEQEKILLIADGLIKEPANWTRGRWKCPAFMPGRDEKGRFIKGKREQVTDDNGSPQFLYCVEGAVNEATLRVLGKERAERFIGDSSEMNGRLATDHLGLNRIAHELYQREAMAYNDWKGSTHEGVREILRTGLARVREKLGKKGRRKSS